MPGYKWNYKAKRCDLALAAMLFRTGKFPPPSRRFCPGNRYGHCANACETETNRGAGILNSGMLTLSHVVKMDPRVRGDDERGIGATELDSHLRGQRRAMM